MVKNELSLRRILVDGSAMNGLLTALIMGSLYYDAEIWLHDYPQEIQERYGPRSERATRLSRLLAIPFLLVLVVGVVRSNLKLKQMRGGRLSFGAAFLNAYALLLYFWLHDLLVIDWFMLMLLKPSFAVLPGTEGMAAYDDALFHLREALPALPLMALPALVVAAGTASRR